MLKFKIGLYIKEGCNVVQKGSTIKIGIEYNLISSQAKIEMYIKKLWKINLNGNLKFNSYQVSI